MLCLELGWGSVEAMRQGLDGDEYIRWWIYFARKAQREELAVKRGR